MICEPSMKRLAFLILLPRLALAQSEPASAPAIVPTGPNPQAEALNDEGKDLFSNKKDYPAAADKFQQAIALSPDARYYYNLCAALDKLEQFDKAVEACDEVFKHDPRAELGQKAGKKSADIREEMKAKGQTAPPPSPEAPPPSSTAATVTKAPEPANDYKWAVGGELGFVTNGFAGRATKYNASYNGFALGAKAYADVLIAPKLGIGVEPYVAGTQLSGDAGLNLIQEDLGVGLYMHLVKIGKSFAITPVVGANVTTMQPFGDGSTMFLGFGFRAQLRLDILISKKDVITVGLPDLTYYLPAAARLAGSDKAADVGLDKGGIAVMFSVGYNRRQTTPFTASDILE
jgi:hypothetical protein